MNWVWAIQHNNKAPLNARSLSRYTERASEPAACLSFPSCSFLLATFFISFFHTRCGCSISVWHLRPRLSSTSSLFSDAATASSYGYSLVMPPPHTPLSPPSNRYTPSLSMHPPPPKPSLARSGSCLRPFFISYIHPLPSRRSGLRFRRGICDRVSAVVLRAKYD